MVDRSGSRRVAVTGGERVGGGSALDGEVVGDARRRGPQRIGARGVRLPHRVVRGEVSEVGAGDAHLGTWRAEMPDVVIRRVRVGVEPLGAGRESVDDVVMKIARRAVL